MKKDINTLTDQEQKAFKWVAQIMLEDGGRMGIQKHQSARLSEIESRLLQKINADDRELPFMVQGDELCQSIDRTVQAISSGLNH